MIRPILAVCLALSTGACVTTGAPPVERMLPAVENVIPPPAPRPVIRRGDDARIAARRALVYGDSNARRLRFARKTYGTIRQTYARP